MIFQSISVHKRYNRKKTTKKYKEILLKLQNNKCIYCDIEFERNHYPTEDHFFPISAGGDNLITNIVLACNECNIIKSDRIFNSIIEAREYIQNKRKIFSITYLILQQFSKIVELEIQKLPIVLKKGQTQNDTTTLKLNRLELLQAIGNKRFTRRLTISPKCASIWLPD